MPSGRTKVIQPFETGVVRAIRVQDGQAVKAGDVLIELDPTVKRRERDHLQQRPPRRAAQHRAAARGARRRGRSARRLHAARRCRPDLISTQRQLLLNQVTEHRAKIAALARQQAQKEAEHATTAATIHKLEATIPGHPAARRYPQDAHGKGAGLEAHLFRRSSSCWSSNRRSSAFRRAICSEAEAAVAAMRETRGQAVAEYERTLSDELAKAEQKANGLAQDLIKAEQRPGFSC